MTVIPTREDLLCLAQNLQVGRYCPAFLVIMMRSRDGSCTMCRRIVSFEVSGVKQGMDYLPPVNSLYESRSESDLVALLFFVNEVRK